MIFHSLLAFITRNWLITRLQYSKLTHSPSKLTHYSPSPIKNSFNYYVNTFSIHLTMRSKTNITISDLLVNFPCKYDRLSLRTHFSSEYAKLTGKNVSQMAFQGLTTEFLNIFVKKYHRNKQSFYRYETRVIFDQ